MELAPKVGLLAVGAVLAFYATSFIPESAARREARLTDEASANAQSACTARVLDKLKAPATAKLSAPIAPRISGDTIALAGYVDAQNSFGATLRQKWLCEGRISSQGKSVDVTLVP